MVRFSVYSILLVLAITFAGCSQYLEDINSLKETLIPEDGNPNPVPKQTPQNVSQKLSISVKGFGYFGTQDFSGGQLTLSFQNVNDVPVKVTVKQGETSDGTSLFNSDREVTDPLDEFTVASSSEKSRHYYIPRVKLEELEGKGLSMEVKLTSNNIIQQCITHLIITDGYVAGLEVSNTTHTDIQLFKPTPRKTEDVSEPTKTETPIPTKTPHETETDEKPDIDRKELEKRIHELVNEERSQRGLNKLSWDSDLAEIARKHSRDMAKNNYFSHTNLEGQGPTERGEEAGYYCRKDFGSYYTEGIGENIFQNWLYDSITYFNGVPSYDWNSMEEIAQSTVQGWMNSPGHRKNILDSTYDSEGIGVTISSDDKVYITQDFC